jgi:hypothetical protein
MPKLFAIVEKTCIKCPTSVASESSFSVGGKSLKAPNKGKLLFKSFILNFRLY